MRRVRTIAAVVAVAAITGLFGYVLVTIQSATERASSEGEGPSQSSIAGPPTERGQRVRSSAAISDPRVASQQWEPVSRSWPGIDPAPGSSGADSTPDAIAGIQARQVQRALEFHARSHGEQSRDPSWSRAHEEQISDHLAAEAPTGASLESVDCRTSQCRVVVMHQDKGFVEWLRHAWGDGPFQYGGFSHFDEQTGSTTIYLGREGYELQQPDLWAAPGDEGDASVAIGQR
jgi:hypothetical protein